MAIRPLVLIGVAVAATGVFSPVWGPALLRQVDVFDVRRVEVSGTRLLAPHEVMATSGIVQGQSVWDDLSAWEQRLRSHPAIEEAIVSRRAWSRSLRVQVVEKRPVALVGNGALRPVTSRGEVLEVDPTRAPIDLPVLSARAEVDASNMVSDSTTRALLAEVGRLGKLDSDLMLRTSGIRAGAAGDLVLTLSHPRAEVVLPRGASYGRLHQFRAVLEELQSRTEGSVPPGLIRVDLRFRDQIVVRLSPSA